MFSLVFNVFLTEKAQYKRDQAPSTFDISLFTFDFDLSKFSLDEMFSSSKFNVLKTRLLFRFEI